MHNLIISTLVCLQLNNSKVICPNSDGAEHSYVYSRRHKKVDVFSSILFLEYGHSILFYVRIIMHIPWPYT